jgi:hypothetical protein
MGKNWRFWLALAGALMLPGENVLASGDNMFSLDDLSCIGGTVAITMSDVGDVSADRLTARSWCDASGHRIGLGHLLQNGNEKFDLVLGGMLHETVKRGSALVFRKDSEPWKRS